MGVSLNTEHLPVLLTKVRDTVVKNKTEPATLDASGERLVLKTLPQVGVDKYNRDS